jgi:hypothetical protein
MATTGQRFDEPARGLGTPLVVIVVKQGGTIAMVVVN